MAGEPRGRRAPLRHVIPCAPAGLGLRGGRWVAVSSEAGGPAPGGRGTFLQTSAPFQQEAWAWEVYGFLLQARPSGAKPFHTSPRAPPPSAL